MPASPLFVRAIFAGVLIDAVATTATTAWLPNAWAGWAAAAAALVSGWIVGHGARRHELLNGALAAALAVAVVVLLVGVPHARGDVLELAALVPLYLAGAFVARVQHARDRSELTRLVDDMDAYHATVLGNAGKIDAAETIAQGAATGYAAGVGGGRIAAGRPPRG